jgi:hypothetical protein
MVDERYSLHSVLRLDHCVAGKMFGKLVPDQASNVTVILHYEDDAQPLHSISQLFDRRW